MENSRIQPGQILLHPRLFSTPRQSFLENRTEYKQFQPTHNHYRSHVRFSSFRRHQQLLHSPTDSVDGEGSFLPRESRRNVLSITIRSFSSARRNPIRVHPVNVLQSYNILHVGVRMDSRQILLVPLHLLHVVSLLDVLRNDDRLHRTEPSDRLHFGRHLLLALQSLLRLLHPQNCKSSRSNKLISELTASSWINTILLRMFRAANSEMVDMVLLDLSGSVDCVRSHSIAVR